MKIKQSHRNGFTLIELILAIGVAAVVLVAVHSVFFTALRLRNATSDAVDAATPIDRAVSTIRRDLQCVVTPKPEGILSGNFKVGNVTTPGISELVAAEMYTATGALSENQPWGDVQRVTYELKGSTSGPGKDLYRGVTRNLLTMNTPEVQDQLMLRGVSSIEFWCFDGSRWTDLWDTSDSTSVSTNLPAAVRVEIQLSDGDKNVGSPIQIVVPIDSQSRTNSTNTVGS